MPDPAWPETCGDGVSQPGEVCYRQAPDQPEGKPRVVGDFDADGVLDLIVIDTDEVHLLVGDGSGAFANAGTIVEADTRMIAGDFDGDGSLDLALPNGDGGGANETVVYLNDGAGPFGARVASPRTEWEWNDAVVGDFDGDADSDIVLVSIDRLELLVADGGGGLVGMGHVEPPTCRFAPVVVGDFDGDSDTDLAANSTCDGGQDTIVSVFLDPGISGLGSPVDYPQPWRVVAVQVGEVTGDGRLDLVTIDANSPDTIGHMQGNGDGSFEAHLASVSVGDTPSEVNAVNADTDGIHDWVYTRLAESPDAAAPRRVLMLTQNDGTGGDANTWFLDPGYTVATLLAGDFNKDGLDDFAYARRLFDSETTEPNLLLSDP